MRHMLDGVVPPILVIAAFLLILAFRLLFVRKRGRPRHVLPDAVVMIVVMCVTVLLELGMGRTVAYRNGAVKLWNGDIQSDQNSQQISDPYTFSHIIHGAAFYGLTHFALGRASPGLRAAVALTLEGAWEAYENTDTVINRYRGATIALGYYGDSVINSVADMLACLLGFTLAKQFRWWFTLSWV
ncbi:MAG: DUF2585 family protein, partial [Gammaproteobacteria bacterium]